METSVTAAVQMLSQEHLAPGQGAKRWPTAGTAATMEQTEMAQGNTFTCIYQRKFNFLVQIPAHWEIASVSVLNNLS